MFIYLIIFIIVLQNPISLKTNNLMLKKFLASRSARKPSDSETQIYETFKEQNLERTVLSKIHIFLQPL